MNAQEVAKQFGDYPKPGLNDADNFILNATPQQLQELIHYISPSSSVNNALCERVRVALDIRLAEEAAKTAEKLIQHTEKLTTQTDIHIQHSEKLTQQTEKLIAESVKLSNLTKVLIWLTVALGAFAVIQIILMVFDIWKHK
jgi:acetylornithine deacetylase/succinyl-diaminopimelate desuccinylase-like protein